MSARRVPGFPSRGWRDVLLKGAVSPTLVLLKNPIKVLVLIGNPLVVA